MKKLFLGLLFCPLFMFGQNVAKVDISNIPDGVNVAIVSEINADSCFSKIVSAIKSQGLFFERLDKENGIITTGRTLTHDRIFNSYCLQVYLEKNELQVRIYAINDYVEVGSLPSLSQIYNSDSRYDQRAFRYLAYWAEKIREVSKGKVVYNKEYNTTE
jgi:hypothetical protein